jgi:hypothetical protein
MHFCCADCWRVVAVTKSRAFARDRLPDPANVASASVQRLIAAVRKPVKHLCLRVSWRQRLSPDAGCRPPAYDRGIERSQLRDGVMPVLHGLEAMLLVLFNLGWQYGRNGRRYFCHARPARLLAMSNIDIYPFPADINAAQRPVPTRRNYLLVTR